LAVGFSLHGPPRNTKVQQKEGDAAVKAYEEDRMLNDAIVDLVVEMSRVEQILFREGAATTDQGVKPPALLHG
jgi:hypothetical protein